VDVLNGFDSTQCTRTHGCCSYKSVVGDRTKQKENRERLKCVFQVKLHSLHPSTEGVPVSANSDHLSQSIVSKHLSRLRMLHAAKEEIDSA